MVLSLFLMLAMSVVAASLMFLSQTETYSSMNYRMMSQARYSAEAGIQSVANYLVENGTYLKPNSGAGPDLLSSYHYIGVSPVTAVANNKPVVLSTDASQANYPYAATETDFVAKLGSTAALSSMALGSTNTTTVGFTASAQLISMDVIAAANDKNGVEEVLQTWLITSDGTIKNSTRTTKIEVSATIDTQKLSGSSASLAYGTFATSGTCGALKFSGGSSVKSYDSSTYSGSGTPASSTTGGNVGTNGNLTESGGATIYGTLSTPRVGVGSCSSGNVSAETTSGGATITGGLVQLPAAASVPTPTVLTPNLGSPTSTARRTAERSSSRQQGRRLWFLATSLLRAEASC
jgi:hypothetical protein